MKEKYRFACGKYARFRHPSWSLDSLNEKDLRMAVISDGLTWDNINSQFSATYLKPGDWVDKMEGFKPNLLFCEATWTGLDMAWDNQIYRNPLFRRDNRSVLKDILLYCKEAGIPTVFWNKEDSPGMQKEGFDFVDTAMLFDHVFTTAVECIDAYRTLGHDSVHLMMFGYSPELFSEKELPDNNKAVFLGSWYNDMPERCNDMRAVFDMVLSHGLELVIYDRASECDNPILQYPEEYAPYIRKAVPYSEICSVFEDARYVININSVKNSRTMFARRVFEAMACGRIVISNESIGMRELFPGRVWFVGEAFPAETEETVIKCNRQSVKENYTFRMQMSMALKSAGLYSLN